MKTKSLIAALFLAAAISSPSQAATLVFSDTNHGTEGWEVDAILGLEVTGYGFFDVEFYRFDERKMEDLWDFSNLETSMAFYNNRDY